jgi:hypothetical protein
MVNTTTPQGRPGAPPEADTEPRGTKVALGRRRLSLGAAAARLRDVNLPRAKTLAELDGDPLSAPLKMAEIIARDRPVPLRLAAQRGSLPPIPKPDAAELAVLVERAALATWSTWISGTSAPAWPDLPERVRERVRASVWAGLVAAGVIQEPERPAV